VSADLPSVLVGGRRLADVARPSGRDGYGFRVMFRSAPTWMQMHTAHHLADELRAEIGPTRVGPITVESFHGHDDVAAALLDPRFDLLPAEMLAAELAGYDVAHKHLGCAVLLAAHSLVLWPQTQPPCGHWSLS